MPVSTVHHVVSISTVHEHEVLCVMGFRLYLTVSMLYLSQSVCTADQVVGVQKACQTLLACNRAATETNLIEEHLA